MKTSLDIYEFGHFRLDEAERTLRDNQRTIQLPPKVFDTLLLLLQNSGHVLSKEKMLTEIWADSFVEENNLAQNISLLRRVLGENENIKFIETVPKFGYRFVAPVNRTGKSELDTEIFEQTRARIYIGDALVAGAPAVAQTPQRALQLPASGTTALSSNVPETHYVRNGNVNLAYQVLGEGDLDIVFVMGWVSHLEYFWKHHLFASFLNRLASSGRLILFDKRGTGLSDRVPLDELPTLEQRMEDVHVVMDAVGSERAILIGVSEGGPMCSLFAATYPERTAALIMIGTYAKRMWDPDYPWAPTVEQLEAFFELMQNEWGKPVGLDDRAPSMADDEEFREWWATYLRMGASPGAAVALTKMNAEIDVRNVLPSIRVPTLVIHRGGDKCLKVEEGRYVASQIPGCKYVELDGIDHLPFVGNQDEILDEIEEFLTGKLHDCESDRVLATVMSIKIDGSSDKALETTNWEELIARSDEFVRHQIKLFRGREISCDQDGLLATFDGPARGIRCAIAIRDLVERLGIPVRTGLHTGECDVLDGKYNGLAVEFAKIIAAEASNGDILVSRTVRDLVAGSGLSFEYVGVRSFPNPESKWWLFKVVR
jgi:pimeloyl-ACP methyl ester carboxylesterase/DNA-binding winged helix-turn-helix (wHTH) protein